MQTNIISIIYVFFLAAGMSFPQVKIDGNIKDEKGRPLPFVNVFIENTFDGDMTNEKGEFSFKTKERGEQNLVASMVGYEKFLQKIILDKNYSLVITLEPESIELKEAVVSGSAYSSEEGKGVVVSKIDVYTTPGGAADLFQSIKTLPGVTNVSESAELYVRGGDPIETVTMIDQAPVYHPYTYESSYGGLFSNFNTAAMKSMFFSSGGFSAKYGNALSGVLEIKTNNEPVVARYGAGISMAGVSFSAEIPMVDSKFGGMVYGRQSYTKPIMWLNGSDEEFVSSPQSRDINAILSYKFSETGRVKITGSYSEDDQGVKIERAEMNGEFIGKTNNKFVNVVVSGVPIKNLFSSTSVSLGSFNRDWKLGVLDLNNTDSAFRLRNENELTLTQYIKTNFGVEFEYRNEKFSGKIPSDDFNLKDDAPFVQLDESISFSRTGGYGEIEYNDFVVKRMFAIVGARFDYFSKMNVGWVDPRFTIGYKFEDESILKLGGGLFGQLPDYRLYAIEDGNPDLLPMRAKHLVLSYDKEFNKRDAARVEIYYKDYDQLPLEDDITNYSSEGYGYAYGLDLIVKGTLFGELSGWVSYGYLNSKRYWMDYKKYAPSDYDITNSFTIVTKYHLGSLFEIGINYKYSTGKPYREIIGNNYISEYDVYEPVYGEQNGARYPDYHRLDVRLSRYEQFFENNFTVFYCEMMNILNINNIFGYGYNSNYTQKEKVSSYFGRRTIVVGVEMTF